MVKVYFKSSIGDKLTTWESVAETESEAIQQGFAHAMTYNLPQAKWYCVDSNTMEITKGIYRIEVKTWDSVKTKYV